MKDKVARRETIENYDRIRLLRGRSSSLSERMAKFETLEINGLNNVSIKDCPKCEHPVLAKYDAFVKYDYQCLTCGSKFTCSEKCVCELIDEKNTTKEK